MSWTTALVWTLGLALLLFWAVGAYNRLKRLRTEIGRAWQKVSDALTQRSAALLPLVAALREPLASEADTLNQCLAALDTAQTRQSAMSAQPLEAESMRLWVAAEASFAASASRISSLLDQHPGLRDPEHLRDLCQRWDQAAERLPFVRQLFAEAIGSYNSALTEFPTRLLTRLFRFKPAGRV